MNSWRARLLCGLILLLAIELHGLATACVSNSPAGMLLFHGSAALVDLFLLYIVPAILTGRLSDTTQTLNLVSIVANFVGWIAYLAYAPPIYYNLISWGLSYVQWGVLLFMGRHDDCHLGVDLVRGSHSQGQQPYFTEAD